MFGMKQSGPHRRHLNFHLGPTSMPPGSRSLAAHAFRVHGEDSGQEDNPGATDEHEPNYGAGDQGGSFNPALDDGGMDPFANVEQPGDPQHDIRLAEFTDPDVDDTWDPPDQVETLRNPVVGFGGELYSGFGPAAIIGAEEQALIDNSPDWMSAGGPASLIGAEPSHAARMAAKRKAPAHRVVKHGPVGRVFEFLGIPWADRRRW